MKYVTYIILLSLTIGCAIKNGTDSSMDDKSFDFFFEEFSSKPDFQASRIQFPLKHAYYEDTLVESVINADEWKYIDFRNDQKASARNEDAYNVEIINKNFGAIEYLRKGIDNGISMSFHFEKKGGQWFLIKIVDRSN